MPRVGKNGGKINVYKIRTMHPYAEYIHGYILKSNGYNNKGKPANDYRITVWGKYLRKYWIDELPQLLNLLKGDMKLIGIRPVSERYLLDIPEDVRNKRLQFKPGCIPPYLGFHFGTTKESIIKAEEMYMNAYEKNPLKTDIFVFFKSIYNILIKKHRYKITKYIQKISALRNFFNGNHAISDFSHPRWIRGKRDHLRHYC